jgi:diacylglycerol kinase (ATP)
MFDSRQLGIILNPEAGRGRAKHILKSLTDCLHEKGVAFQLEQTNAPGHAKDIALRMKEDHEIILAAGGDGTINEVTSGIINSKTALAVLPVGSGNDFNKMIGIPKKISQAVTAILYGKKKLIDLGQGYFWNSLGEKKKCHFVNTLGIGLDAEIAHETRKIKLLRGLPLYLLAAIKALYKHTPNEYKLIEGNRTWIEKAFLICIGNGCFEGGGFKLLPRAITNDSRLDICLIKDMPILKALKIIPHLIKGSHFNKNRISMWKSKEIRIESKSPFVIHCDGEVLTNDAVKIKVELSPKKINVIVPA